MKSVIKLVIIYIVAVAGYAVFITRFTIPVHLNVDEELYISMARSFHYDGMFSQNGQILNYSCVLYSMLLSLAYFFYHPEHIMFALRMIGIMVMLSSIFPIYLLSKEISGRGQQAIKVTAFACVLPSMMHTAYCLQEVLCYPLSLWLLYAVYIEIRNNKIDNISWEMWPITIMGVLCYFTKTYMIFFPVIYCIFIVINSFREKRFAWKKPVIFLGTYFILYLLFKQMILYINNGVVGTNHYDRQFSWLFPITGDTIISAVSCIVFYTIALAFYVGVLPLVLPLINYKKYDENDRKFLLFIFGALAILIVEVVISIVLTEEGNVLVPRKFLWRYFQIFEVPLILLFLKKYKDFKIPAWIWKVYVMVFGYLTVYYVYIGTEQKTSISDAPVFLLMENINRYIIPYFNVLACMCGALAVILAYVLQRRNKIRSITGSFIQLTALGIIILFLINLFQLPFYTNVTANGSAIQADAIRIVDYWQEHYDTYEKVYFVKTEHDRYEGNVYAYFPIGIYKISENELDTIQDNSLIILSKSSEVSTEMKELNLDTEMLRVVIAEAGDKQ